MSLLKKVKSKIRSYIEGIVLKTVNDQVIMRIIQNNEACMSTMVNKHITAQTVKDLNQFNYSVWGKRERLHIATTACMVNTQFNTSSGEIIIGDYTFTGHNVSIITGCHDYRKFGKARQEAFPLEGNDITIGNGVWLGSNSVVIGPNQIGDNAVIAAGAIVIPNTNPPADTIYGGIPARLIKKIDKTTTVDDNNHTTHDSNASGGGGNILNFEYLFSIADYATAIVA